MAFLLFLSSTARRRKTLRWLVCGCLVAGGFGKGTSLFAQQTTGTLRGVVVNRATGQPIARVMVDAPAVAPAVLTDSAGRFSFADVPFGAVQLHYYRPGYLDPLTGQSGASRQVTLTADAPVQVLPLDATAALRGQLLPGEGDSAAGIRVDLYQAHIEDGRRDWQQAQTVRARGDGSFSFGNLRAGSYVVHAQASEDPVPPGMPEGGRTGYAPVFAPNASDPGSATVYSLQPGETEDVRLRVARVGFYPVSVRVAGEAGGGSFEVSGNGFTHWPVRYSREDDALRTELPSGNYVLQTSGGGRQPLQGELALHVDGAPVSGLSISLNAVTAIPVAAELAEGSVSSSATTTGTQARVTEIMASAVESSAQQQMMFQGVTYAGSDGAGTLSAGMRPGRYWVQAIASGGYVAALTSGGTNLFTEPLTVAAGGTPEIEASIRQDGGTVGVVLSGEPAEQPCVLQLIPLGPGGAARTRTVQQAGAAASFTNVPPGDYLVLATEARVGIAFREPGVLAELTGARVTVTANGTAQATVSAFFEPPPGTTGAQ